MVWSVFEVAMTRRYRQMRLLQTWRRGAAGPETRSRRPVPLMAECRLGSRGGLPGRPCSISDTRSGSGSSAPSGTWVLECRPKVVPAEPAPPDWTADLIWTSHQFREGFDRRHLPGLVGVCDLPALNSENVVDPATGAGYGTTFHPPSERRRARATLVTTRDRSFSAEWTSTSSKRTPASAPMIVPLAAPLPSGTCRSSRTSSDQAGSLWWSSTRGGLATRPGGASQ